MPWYIKQYEGVYTTCSVIDYDNIKRRQCKHHAIGQVRSAFAGTFLLSFKEHRAEAHREHRLQSQQIHSGSLHWVYRSAPQNARRYRPKVLPAGRMHNTSEVKLSCGPRTVYLGGGASRDWRLPLVTRVYIRCISATIPCCDLMEPSRSHQK